MGYFTPKYFRRGGRKKGNLLNFFCFYFLPFQADTLQFMDWSFTFLLFLYMNTLTENKCLCRCLFSHLLYCWLDRKCNLDICRCSYFELISTSFLWFLTSSKFWACVVFWSISGKSTVGIFLSEKWELIHLRQISGYLILINSSR